VTGLQTALDGKAPTSHTHTIANVTNLQTTLDGKAPTSHTHTKAQVTDFAHTHPSGEVTGLATVATSGAYSDLTGKPTLGTAADNAETDFATAGHTHAGLVPAGGAQGAVLKKVTAADHDYTWGADEGGGSGATTFTGLTDTPSDYVGDAGKLVRVNAGATALEFMTPDYETGADVTDATNVDAAGAVMNADYNANTILAATTDNTPAALTVGASTVLGRKATGNISAMTAAETKTVLGLATVATSGAYGDLSGRPTLGTAADNAETDFAAAVHTHTKAQVTDFAHTHPAATEVTGLATVATTGAYGDLSGKPTLGTAADNAETDFAAAVHSHSGLAPAGGTTGQVLKKTSNGDYAYSWGTDETAAGGGDMLKATYDPTNIAGDAFARANHTGAQAISTVTGLQTALDAKLALAGGTLTGGLVLGTGASVNGGGKQIAHHLLAVVTSVSGTLTTTAHSGNVVVTSGNITVPTTAGFHCTVIAGGAHTITFNGTVCPAMAAGDVVSLLVQSATVIKAVKVAAANLLAFS
jgi:hypothetical protein